MRGNHLWHFPSGVHPSSNMFGWDINEMLRSVLQYAATNPWQFIYYVLLALSPLFLIRYTSFISQPIYACLTLLLYNSLRLKLVWCHGVLNYSPSFYFRNISSWSAYPKAKCPCVFHEPAFGFMRLIFFGQGCPKLYLLGCVHCGPGHGRVSRVREKKTVHGQIPLQAHWRRSKPCIVRPARPVCFEPWFLRGG